MNRRRIALLAAAVAGVAIAVAATGSSVGPNTANDALVTFTPATVVDPILFGGEPGLTFDPTTTGSRSFVDWPVSSTTNIGVLFRSTDGGLSYTKRYMDAADPVSGGPACQGRQVPFCFSGGGGDTTVNINATTGVLAMGNQESLVNQAVGVSLDHGTTFPADHVDAAVAKASGVDRQWLASWKGTKTVFLAYHLPAVGEFVNRSDNDGMVGSWSIPTSPQVPLVTQSGSFVADNTGGIHNRALYLGYLDFNVGGFSVAVSTDGAKTFTSHSIPGAKNARNFTVLALDNVGNLYATWVDSNTQQTYLSTSKADAGANRTAPGTLWSTPVQVSASPVHLSIFSNAVAGSPGRIGIGYYGTKSSATTPDTVKPGQGGWYPYLATSYNALCQWDAKPCNAPRFHQTTISAQPNQDDNICTAGTTCAATQGNRNLADYFSISLDKSGFIGAVWSDGYNATLKPFVKVARQATGPSLYAGMPDAHVAIRQNGAPDAVGDARYPIAGPKILTAPNHPTLDLKGTRVTLKGKTLEVSIALASARNLGKDLSIGTVDGTTILTQEKYVARWDYHGGSYYVGASVPMGGAQTPTFFSGTVNTDEGLPGTGSGIYYGNKYTAMTAATGHVVGGSLVIDVPVSLVGNPKAGAKLISVGSYSMVAGADQTMTLFSAPIVVDSAPTFDVRL